ncbi:group 3 secretory phospholipase A2-like [Eucyclogobius newberryi]|uniref:group 3 secretory phospholipase A2-like n=1 Tax=Eucyclogobius newberryi TaxID=166745 RepID=UPI003B59D942
MPVRWIAFIQNVIAIQTLVECKLQTVMGPGTISCLTESYFGQGHTQVTFLREDSGLALYVSLWSEDVRLLACDVMSNALVIENYKTSCNRSSGEKERLSHRFNLSVILSPFAPCVKTDALHEDRSHKEAEPKMRTKRSWIFPGTLWCGTGSQALGYDELGMFESADRCCREHDHCQHTIRAFTVNYGVFNSNFFTVSHCDCDQRFRQCLMDVNDTISSMVLYSFFKLLKVPCIELKLQKRCTEMYWWGMCKVTQEAPYAIFKRLVYNNTAFISNSEKGGSSMPTVSEAQRESDHEIEPSRKKLKQEEKCVSKDPPRGDTFFRKKTKGCRRKVEKISTVAPYRHTTLLNKDISRKTKRLKSLGIQSGGPKTTNPHLLTPCINPTTASSKRPVTQKAFLSQNKDSPLTSTFPAVVPKKDTATAKWMFTTNVPKRQMSSTTSAQHYDNTTTKPLAHYLESKKQSQMDIPFGRGKPNKKIINIGDVDLKENESSHIKTDFCESLKHLDECSYKIPPLKKRFGLKNLDTKPAYHCACTRRLAREIRKSKQSKVASLLEDSVSENCFKLPKRKKCHHRNSCSGGFSKASDLLQALKKIEQNDIARVQNSSKHRKGRISVQLYKRCLRLRNEAMAPLT